MRQLSAVLILISMCIVLANAQVETKRPTIDIDSGGQVSGTTVAACNVRYSTASQAMPLFYDDDPSHATSSVLSIAGASLPPYRARQFSGWQTSTSQYGALAIYVKASCRGTCGIEYSSDGGGTWAPLMDVSGGDTDGTYTAALAPTQSLSQLRVRACVTPTPRSGVSGSTASSLSGFDIWTEGTVAQGPRPTVVNPNEGPLAGGTRVTIGGSGFVVGATVKFGGVAATNVSVVSATSITATTPAHQAGQVAVEVRNSNGQLGTLPNAYSYNPPPVPLSISPPTGSMMGGTAVSISGTGFRPGATVTFAGMPATNVNVVSSTLITANTPAHGMGAVDVVIINTDRQTGALYNTFTFSDPPPLPPTDLFARVPTGLCCTIQLSWRASIGFKVSYIVRRHGFAISAPITATSYVDHNVQPNTYYLYDVIAVNEAGSSAPSEPYSILTPELECDASGDKRLLGQDAYCIPNRFIRKRYMLLVHVSGRNIDVMQGDLLGACKGVHGTTGCDGFPNPPGSKEGYISWSHLDSPPGTWAIEFEATNIAIEFPCCQTGYLNGLREEYYEWEWPARSFADYCPQE